MKAMFLLFLIFVFLKNSTSIHLHDKYLFIPWNYVRIESITNVSLCCYPRKFSYTQNKQMTNCNRIPKEFYNHKMLNVSNEEILDIYSNLYSDTICPITYNVDHCKILLEYKTKVNLRKKDLILHKISRLYSNFDISRINVNNENDEIKINFYVYIFVRIIGLFFINATNFSRN